MPFFKFTFSVPSFVTNFLWGRFNGSEPQTPTSSRPSTPRESDRVVRRTRARAAVNIRGDQPNSYRLPPKYGFAPTNPSPPLAISPSPVTPSVSFWPFPTPQASVNPFNSSSPIASSWYSSSPEIDMIDVPPSAASWNHFNSTFGHEQTSSRPQIHPIPFGRRQNTAPTTTTVDLASEIEIEEDDGTLPAGYIGTWRGNRFTVPTSTTAPQCTSNQHLLSCGHWIETTGDSQCGINCSAKEFSNAAFICPTCVTAVDHVVRNQLHHSERAELKRAWECKQETWLGGRLVELVKERTGGGDAAAPVMSYLHSWASSSNSRKCVAVEAPHQREALLGHVREYLRWKADRESARSSSSASPRGVKRSRGEGEGEPEPEAMDVSGYEADVDVVMRGSDDSPSPSPACRDPSKRLRIDEKSFLLNENFKRLRTR